MHNKHQNRHNFTCSTCHHSVEILSDSPVFFCPACGHSNKVASLSEESHLPLYEIAETIGKGGMGEVYAAFDLRCQRKIALKRIRPDLIDHPQIRHRFLKEAYITCQLVHPAIIPIYTIVSNEKEIFYTMPLVEGKTLKETLKKIRHTEKSDLKTHTLGHSIPSLIHVFMTVCQAVAYAHSKKVIHRDLKPENIIIGKYGEVLILDWGLAKWLDNNDEDGLINFETPYQENIQNLYQTKVGKVVGTIPYMAPERAFGSSATVQTDIYSLGVILYQILTLKNPFKRKTLEEFRKNIDKEELIDPVLAAPHRDIPKMLAEYTIKCLAKSPQDRYKNVDELVRDLKAYIEGRSDWFLMASLDVKRKVDWEFQENILIAEHIAITRLTDETEWMSLMISKQSFTGNIKLETTINLGDNSYGIGFLFSVPELCERNHLNEGYCLWIGSDNHRSTKLLKSNVEIVEVPDIFLKRNHLYEIRIEKIDKSIHFYINNVPQFSYLVHLPLLGTHIGLISKDADYEIGPLNLSVGSLSLNVNCLSIPDAFLAHGDYPKALSEYRRIAYSFPDRSEGREALFRAGLTLIEQAKNGYHQQEFLTLALAEFEKLHGTPSAPLEYLGKALVYESLNDNEEEIKCFELAYRRYPHHPLLPILQEHILSRMQEVARKERIDTYRFISLVVRQIPASNFDNSTQRIFQNLQKHWELLPFVDRRDPEAEKKDLLHLTIPLLFWLGQPNALEEILDLLLVKETLDSVLVMNILYCFLEWGIFNLAREKLQEIERKLIHANFSDISHLLDLYECGLTSNNDLLSYFKNTAKATDLKTFFYFIDYLIDREKTELALDYLKKVNTDDLSQSQKIQIDTRMIWAYLLEKDWQKASTIFSFYSIEFLNKDSTILHFLYGCWLLLTEGQEISDIHMRGLFMNNYPRSWTLASHYLVSHLSLEAKWGQQAFFWEKKQLYRQLTLYYHIAEAIEEKAHFQKLYFTGFTSQ